jgi:hypothetical protein
MHFYVRLGEHHLTPGLLKTSYFHRTSDREIISCAVLRTKNKAAIHTSGHMIIFSGGAF